MKPNTCRVAVILDRSGSMSAVKNATIDGFNEFVNGQRAIAGQCSLKLVQFDHEYEEVFDKPLGDVPKLTAETYCPRGNTALLDSIGRTVVSLGEALSKMAEADRPSKVIVVVITDGFENASQEYSQAMVAEMVKHQRERYSWDFVFLGANQDAVLTAAKYNIPAVDALTYRSTGSDVHRMYGALSASIGSRRTGGRGSFRPSDLQQSTEPEREDVAPPRKENR